MLENAFFLQKAGKSGVIMIGERGDRGRGRLSESSEEDQYVIGTPADLQRTWKEETREERLEKK